MLTLKKKMRGVHLNHNKNTENSQTVTFLNPETVIIPMSQHIGAPCVPVVAVGDEVQIGQVIGDSQEAFSAPIHASVSGEVISVGEILMPNGNMVKAVTIKNDFKETIAPEVKPPVINNTDDFIRAVHKSGLVGLGGAGFPTHIKFKYKDMDKIQTLIINAAECEPYITSDYRQCVENSDQIFDGINLVMKYLDIAKCHIVFEKNAPKSAQIMKDKFANDSRIEINVLDAKYPKGAEKVTIYETTRKVIMEGNIPADHGVLVLNVTTISKIADYVKTGMPLVTKRITIDGAGIKQNGNVFVKLGTKIADVANHFGGMTDVCDKILMGGPMTGLCIADDNMPIVKNNNAILFLQDQKQNEPSNCIKCSKCINTCPIELMPNAIERAFDAKDKEDLKALRVSLCVNCGCCSYICPAKRNLAAKNQLAKALIR